MPVKPTIDHLIYRDFAIVTGDTALPDLRQTYVAGQIIIVVDTYHYPIGVITADILAQMDNLSGYVGDYIDMTELPTLTSQGAPLQDILNGMDFDKTIRWHVVFDDGVMVGVLRPPDLFEAFPMVDDLLSISGNEPDPPASVDTSGPPPQLMYRYFADKPYHVVPGAVTQRDADGYALSPIDQRRMIPANCLVVPPTPAYLNTRFDGVAPDHPLPVGQRVPFVVWVGAASAQNYDQRPRLFTFVFPDEANPVEFQVHVRADPDNWVIKAVETLMVVTPAGKTTQAAEFVIMAKCPGRDKLYISVARADTGAVIQDIWLPVEATSNNAVTDDLASTLEPPGTNRAGLAADTTDSPADRIEPVETRDAPEREVSQQTGVTLPFTTRTVKRRSVRITFQQAGSDSGTCIAFVDADLSDGRLYQSFRIPLSVVEVQNATLRLRQELERIVLYQVTTSGQTKRPFTSLHDLTVDRTIARQSAVPLADVGNQVWRLLFDGPRTPDELRQFAARLRDLPAGSMVQVVLDNPQVIIPWALLYDKPGQITADTLDWAGFWGYRYLLDVLVPGNYPDPLISDDPLGLYFVFNNEHTLQRFTRQQASFVANVLGRAQCTVGWGVDDFLNSIRSTGAAALLYYYCHGEHKSGAVQDGALVGESALSFSPGRCTRLVDLRRLQRQPVSRRPLVFVNACEGATQDAFYYDGFMPFFIEQHGARGFIGTEVKAPTLLAHDFALEFLRRFAQGQEVGAILWQLRRHYLDTHNTILAFNYSLYGLGETRLAQPLVGAEG